MAAFIIPIAIAAAAAYSKYKGDQAKKKSADTARGAYGEDIGALIERLRAQAEGRDTVTDQKLKQATGQNIAAEQAFAATGRGNQALQQRQASQNIGGLRSGLAGQAAMADVQERSLSNQQLGGLLAQLRGQQMGFETSNPATSGWDRLAGGLQAGGAAYAMSDVRVKTNIAAADEEADALLDGLRAYSYDYKNPKHGKGRQLGVMAQDLERAGLQQAVIDTPEGKAVDGAKLAGALAAATSSLHRRVKRLES